MAGRRSTHLFLTLLATIGLAAPLTGCEEPGELSPLVSRDVFTLQFDELTAFNTCDPPSSAPGDFYLSARLVDASLGWMAEDQRSRGPGIWYTLDELRSRLVQTNAGTVTVDFGVEGKMLPPVAGDELIVSMSFFEKDTNDYVTARQDISLFWGRDSVAGKACWLLEGAHDDRCFDTDSIVPGQMRGAFRLDDNGPSPCEATLSWTLTLDEALVPRPPSPAGTFSVRLRGYIDTASEGSGDVRVCSEPITLTIDPTSSRSVTGSGTCYGETRAGHIAGSYEVRGQYDDDESISGDILFDLDGEAGTVSGRYPFVGRINDRRLELLYEGPAEYMGEPTFWWGTVSGIRNAELTEK